ncbi:MAG: hypothetical protein CM1200mP22_13190 [Dehalococcoidia bacterium]|nr:MAG: hypothetical protein CM1200mP22_13190 [Dehalococcoidia bacterium]
MTVCRGIRGATTADANTEEAIHTATDRIGPSSHRCQ